jgi:hypothetical protein
MYQPSPSSEREPKYDYGNNYGAGGTLQKHHTDNKSRDVGKGIWKIDSGMFRLMCSFVVYFLP